MTDIEVKVVEKLKKILTEDKLQELQQEVNELKKSSIMKNYVEERKLHLLTDDFRIYDLLLKAGLLK